MTWEWPGNPCDTLLFPSGKGLALPNTLQWKKNKMILKRPKRHFYETSLFYVRFHMSCNISIKFSTHLKFSLCMPSSPEHRAPFCFLWAFFCSLRCLELQIQIPVSFFEVSSSSHELLYWLSIWKEKNAGKQLILVCPSTTNKSLAFTNSSAAILLNHCYILSHLISNIIFGPHLWSQYLSTLQEWAPCQVLNIYCLSSVSWRDKRMRDFFFLSIHSHI